jgi:hypothetical protein
MTYPDFTLKDHPLTWEVIKSSLPKTSKALIGEYRRTNGFLPYEQGYVYMIHAVGTDYYKIGKTINPDKRILQIAPKMPFSVRFKHVWPSNFMSYSERFLHLYFENFRVNGEWFDFSKEVFDSNFFEQRLAYDTIRNAYASHFYSLFDPEETAKNIDMSLFISTIFDAMTFSASETIGVIERLFSEISYEIVD